MRWPARSLKQKGLMGGGAVKYADKTVGTSLRHGKGFDQKPTNYIELLWENTK